MAAMSINWDGKVMVPAARETVTRPSPAIINLNGTSFHQTQRGPCIIHAGRVGIVKSTTALPIRIGRGGRQMGLADISEGTLGGWERETMVVK